VLAEAMNRHDEPLVLTMKDIVEWVRSSIQGRLYDTDLELRKAMKEVGAIWYEDRFLIGGRFQLAAMNTRAFEMIKEKHSLKMIKNVVGLVKNDDTPDTVTQRKLAVFEDLKRSMKKPGDISNASM